LLLGDAVLGEPLVQLALNHAVVGDIEEEDSVDAEPSKNKRPLRATPNAT
jgi:hypothetical protein